MKVPAIFSFTWAFPLCPKFARFWYLGIADCPSYLSIFLIFLLCMCIIFALRKKKQLVWNLSAHVYPHARKLHIYIYMTQHVHSHTVYFLSFICHMPLLYLFFSNLLQLEVLKDWNICINQFKIWFNVLVNCISYICAFDHTPIFSVSQEQSC